MTTIPFIDLQTQKKRMGANIEAAIQRVLAHGGYIMGPEVFELETKLSEFSGAKHSISCSNGTDALTMVLMAKGIKAGDAVFVPSFTFAATAEVVVLRCATPVFVDVLPDTFNMDPRSLEQAICVAKQLGLNPSAVIPVDIFGQPADYDAIEDICAKNQLWLLSDAAQSFGATYKGRKVGTIGLATSTSFFPAKPLGCYGDGGAVFTDDDELARILRSIRVHGQGSEDKYENVRIGINGRLDTIQAAILIEKLKIFPSELAQRDQVAERYHAALKDIVQVQSVMENTSSTWAQYAFLLEEASQRADVLDRLKTVKIPTAIYYPKPLHKQIAYSQYPTASKGSLPISENLSARIMSIPMHPYLDTQLQSQIVNAVYMALNESVLA